MHDHLIEAINWLKRAHDSTDDHGVGYGYYLRGNPFQSNRLGWRASYVETSGYIVETFYNIAQVYSDSDAAERAEKIAHWLISVQNQDGSFSNLSLRKNEGIVFDTGQVLFGLLRAYQETQNKAFAIAARKAAYWLVTCQSEDGAWRQHTHQNIVHTYNTRVAWALTEYCKLFPDVTIKTAAGRNLDWALRQQTDEGLFHHSAFKTGVAPYTHTIAYIIRGLFEAGRCLGDTTFQSSAYQAAKRVAQFIDIKTGFLPGAIGHKGMSDTRYACLTGNCQMAIIWYKMAKLYQDDTLLKAANKALEYVLSVHDIHTANDNLRGGVKGSHPIWGRYTPLAYPNWATKFLIDAIMERPPLRVT